METTTALYDTDFYAWIPEQVRLLKAMMDAIACMPFGEAQNGSRTARRCAPMALHRGFR